MTSFVRICFEILGWNFDDENYRKLFAMFEDGTQRMPNLPDPLVIEFEVDPAYFGDHNDARDSALTIWTHGYGLTDMGERRRRRKATGLWVFQPCWISSLFKVHHLKRNWINDSPRYLEFDVNHNFRPESSPCSH